MKTDEGYELIKGLIETRAASDPKIRSLLNRIAKGDADFKTTSEYSRIVSEILGTSLSEHILDLDDAAREEVCRMLLHDRYEDINDVLAEVQTSLDAKTGINIRPKKPPFQAERVASFAHSLADHTVVDQVIKRRARNGSANISMSDHDRYMKTNAELRNKAGLKCYIERETDGKCCEWCTKMAGRYAYPDDTPKDVFRRHDNCGCTVTYKNGRQRQDVWSKKTWEADKDERISKASEKEPTAFTKAEAQAKQSEILARKELTYDKKSGIIISGAISGALNPYSKEAERHAVQYYESVRHMKKDIKRISDATGISQDKIEKIKQHIFVLEHDLLDGRHRFAPSYDMAQSWQRLINNSFEEKDIVLLKHEYAELRYMEKGLSQNDAHIKASKKYNYAKYCE